MEANLRRWLYRLDPELAHRLGLCAAWLADHLASSYLQKTFEYEAPILRQKIWGVEFANPIGLAAGYDKNGLLVRFWDRLGFGHAEIGSVTLHRTRGNPKPRLFRLEEDQAIINRLGLPNKGARRVARRLSRRPKGNMPIGVSIARGDGDTSVTEDYCQSASKLLPYANYLTVNASCPNTKGGKILELSDHLDLLLGVLVDVVDNRVPILLKLSPLDSSKVIYDSQTDRILETAMRHRISGFVVANTVSDRQGLYTPLESLNTMGRGGLSGPPIYERAVQMVRYVRAFAGPEYTIIGVGGISSAEDAYRMICAGASLLQIYTALVYKGPGIVQQIKKGLVERLQSDGHTSIESAIGTAPDFTRLHEPVFV